MGLVIITDKGDLQKDKSVEESPDCVVCQCDKQDPINDIERIFKALEKARLNKEDLSKLDEKMCNYHAKKTRGLKIKLDKDYLMELDSQSVSSNPTQGPRANRITEEQYNKEVELEDGETEMSQ